MRRVPGDQEQATPQSAVNHLTGVERPRLDDGVRGDQLALPVPGIVAVLGVAGTARRTPLGQAARLVPETVDTWVSLSTAGRELDRISELVRTGRVRPHIERTFPLEELVQAHEFAEAGRVTGKLVITL